MPSEYLTQEQWAELMQQPPGSPGIQTDYGLGAGPGPVAAAAATAPETPTQGAQTKTEAAPAPTSPTAEPASASATPPKPAAPEFNLSAYQARPGPYADLFAPITNALGEGHKEVAKQAGEFSEAAGSHRTWENVGGAGLFEQAYKPEASSEDLGKAVDLIKARYQGPTEIDPKALAALRVGQEQLQAAGGGLTNVGGVSDLLRQKAPGLTPGELTFEAKGLLSDPLFQEAARGIQGDIGGLEAEIAGAAGTAQSYGKQRGEEEKALAEAAQAIPRGKMSEVDAQLAAAIEERQAEEAALQGLYDKALADGVLTLDEIQSIDPEQGKILAKSGPFKDAAKAAKERARLEAEFKDIADVPFYVPDVTARGNVVVGFPEKWYLANRGNPNIDEWKQRAEERQRAYEAAGFSPGLYMDNPGLLQKAGNLADIDPLYFGDGKPLNPGQALTQHFQLELGTGANKQNQASDAQRFVYNRSAELLELADRLEKPETGYEGPGLTNMADDYVEALKTVLRDFRGEKNAALQDFLYEAGKYRKGVSKKKKTQSLRRLARIGLGIMSFGLSEIARETPGIGKWNRKLEQELGNVGGAGVELVR